MKKICTLVTLTLYLAAGAQDTTTSKDGSQFKLSLNFNSHLNYYGRTDSLKSTGLFPTAEFWISPEFYISASPVFVNNQLQSLEYAGTVATIGYQKISEKWLTSLYASKPFYTETSQLVQSALKAQSGLTVSRLNKIVNITLGGDVKFSDQTDFGATAGLDHIIRIENKDGSIWVLDPSAYIYAGTQNFTNTYYRKKKASILSPAIQEQVTERVQAFNVLAWEVFLPVIYARQKWMFMATPSYILPQNLITVANRPDLSERGQKMFYLALTVKRTF